MTKLQSACIHERNDNRFKIPRPKVRVPGPSVADLRNSLI